MRVPLGAITILNMKIYYRIESVEGGLFPKIGNDCGRSTIELKELITYAPIDDHLIGKIYYRIESFVDLCRF